MQTELHGLAGFSGNAHYQAAAHCFKHGIYPGEAMKEVDRSIGMKATFSNMNLKSRMLAKAGNTAEADKLQKKALEKANENELNMYGYELMGMEKVDEAITIFKLNVKRHPKSWNVFDSLGEAFMTKGNKKSALTNYQTALSMAPEKQHKRINGMISKAEKLNSYAQE